MVRYCPKHITVSLLGSTIRGGVTLIVRLAEPEQPIISVTVTVYVIVSLLRPMGLNIFELKRLSGEDQL